MVKFTERDIAIVAGLAGAADFLTEGRFSAPAARALKRIFRKAAPTAARTVPRLAGTALGVGKQIALRHPVLTGGAVVYYTYKNRKELGDLVEKGYEVIQPVVQPIQSGVSEILDITAPGRAELIETMVPRRPVTARRKKSAFNRAVSAGMKTVKASPSYGKKGTINNAKKAFSVVTKVVSAAKKGKKKPRSGIRAKIFTAARRFF
jgi:hypothetical protein